MRALGMFFCIVMVFGGGPLILGFGARWMVEYPEGATEQIWLFAGVLMAAVLWVGAWTVAFARLLFGD